MFIDSWGNEYKTEQEAKEGLLKICREQNDYYKMLAEYMDIPFSVINWILKENLYSRFADEFKKDIYDAEDNWIDYYLCDLYYTED